MSPSIDTLEGSPFSPQDARIAIVVSRFNTLITEKLLQGAIHTLYQHNLSDDRLLITWVPGAFELPLAAMKLARSGAFDAVITLGCVIRGATTHYDYICSQAASGVTRAAMETGRPVIFGVLTTENQEQAWERAGGKAGNKGSDAAIAAIEMLTLMRQIDEMPALR